MRAAREVLRHKPFGRLFTGYTVNQIGDYVGLVALSVLVYAETDSAMATAGLFIAMQFVPAIAAPALTARIDQYSLARALPALYALEAALFGLLVLLADSFWLPGVLIVAFLDGTLMLSARALLRAGVNTVLEPVGRLREGNGVLNVGFALASVAGAALGGLLVEAFGVGTALALDGVTFLLVAGLLLTAPSLHADRAVREPLGPRLREGFAHAWRSPLLRVLIVGEGAAIMFFALVFPIEVIYARDTLGTDEAGYGTLLASWGAGILLGSAVFLRSRRPLLFLVVVSTLAIGLAYTGMGLVRELWAACLLSVLGGAGNGVQWVSVMTAVQQDTPEELQARTTGLLESTASLATGVGFLTGGVLVSLTSPPTAFLVSGIAVIVLVAAGVLARARPRRRREAPSAAA
jgi:predicted MFS family arabinose efflux permease